MPQNNAQGVPQGNVVNVTGYHDEKASTAPLVIGIILCAISTVNLLLLLTTGYFITLGWIFIVLAVFGIVSCKQSHQAHGRFVQSQSRPRAQHNRLRCIGSFLYTRNCDNGSQIIVDIRKAPEILRSFYMCLFN